MKRFLTYIIIAITLAVSSLPAMAAPAEATASQVEAAVSVKSGTGFIEITVPGDARMHFNIYSITGQLVKSLEAGPGKIIVDMPQGCYIVKCSAWSRKVVVK